MKGRSGHAVKLAEWYRQVITRSAGEATHYGVEARTARWLGEFFKVEPEVEEAFRAWVERTAEQA